MRSELGKGTRITVRLPFDCEAPVRSAPKPRVQAFPQVEVASNSSQTQVRKRA